MMRAGKRDRKVTFYPIATSEDSLGVEAESRGSGVPAYANISYGAASERREAGQAGSSQVATFRVLATPTLKAATERWEIEDDRGSTWGITGIAPVGNVQRELEFTATRSGA